MSGNWRLAWLIAWREKTTSGFKIIAFALALCIFSVTLIFNLVLGLNTLLLSDISTLLGASLILESPEPLPKLAVTLAKDLGLETTEVIDFFSMVVAKEKMELASVSSIGGKFPLRGKLMIRQKEGKIAQIGPPPSGEIWAEEGLLLRLKVKLYDKVNVGDTSFTITGIIDERPVALSETSILAPFAYVNEDNLAQMNVLRPGSRATYRLLLTGSGAQISAFQNSAKEQLSHNIKWVTPESGRTSVGQMLTIVQRYLSIILLIQAVLAGMAIAMTAYQHTFRLQREVALWRCLGATHRQVLLNHTFGYLCLPLLVIVISVILAYGATYEIAHYAKQWGDYTFSLSPKGALVGIGVGVLLLAGFGLPPIMALKQISPRVILQQSEQRISVNIKWYGLTLLMVGLLFSWGIQDAELAIKFIAQLILLSAFAFAILWALWDGLASFNQKISVQWRLALSYLIRYRVSSVFQCLVFTVVVTLLLLVYIFQTDFLKSWQAQLPVSTPNYFLINIQAEQLDNMRGWLAKQGVKNVEFFPIVRGRLTFVNQEGPKELHRPINLTWMKNLPKDNRVIEGVDWESVSSRHVNISVEKEFAKRQGVKLGDTFTFDIGGETIRAKIVQFRTVEWESFKPNFFVIFPPGILEKYAHSYISSFYLDHNEKKILVELVKNYPGVSIIDIDAFLEKIRNLTHKLGSCLTVLFILVGSLGLLIMHASLLSTLKERINESALLRILGANNVLIKKVFWIEFTILAGISGLLGSVMAIVLAQMLAKQFFIGSLVLQIKWLAIGVMGSIVLIPLFGMIGVRSVFKGGVLRLFRDAQ